MHRFQLRSNFRHGFFVVKFDTQNPDDLTAERQQKPGSDTVENYAIEKTNHTDIIAVAFFFWF